MKSEQADKILELVKRNYQEIAASFNISRKKEIWPKIRDFTAVVKDGDSVLDAGCGNGRLIEALKNKKIKYLGLDNSPELIAIAKKNYPTNEFRLAEILNMDNVPEKNFDYIFCLAVWQHIPSRELRLKFLNSLATKLKSSGQLIISVWDLSCNPKYRRMIRYNYLKKMIGRYRLSGRDLIFPWKNSTGLALSDRYYHAFTIREIKKLSVAANLKIKEIQSDTHNIWVRY